jgi:outer membrane protein TolC
MKKALAIPLFGLLVALGTAAAQAPADAGAPAPPDAPALTLTLAQATEAALARGADSAVLQRTLDIGREQYQLSVSQGSFALSGSLGENAAYGFGDATLLTGNSLASGFSQTPQAGLSLASPLTSVGVTVTPYVAPNPLLADLAQLSSIFSPSAPAAAPGATGSIGLNVSQVLWNGYPGGTVRASLEKALLSLRGKELSTQAGRQNIVSAVTQAYFVMLGAQRTLAVKGAIAGQQNALLSQMRAIHEIQQATTIDLRTAEINAQSADIDARGAENDLRIARIRLAQLIGLPRETPFTLAEEQDPQLPAGSVEQAIEQALQRRTEPQQVELNRRAAAIDRDLIRGMTTPTVSVSGGVTVIHDWQLLSTAGQGTMGLKVALPLLDAGAADHQIEANRIQNEVYGVQQEQLRARIATDVEEAWELVQVSLQRLQVARLGAEKFELKFSLKKTEAQYGTAKNQDLLDASIDLANARSAVVRAQRDAQLAVLQLRNAMGY